MNPADYVLLDSDLPQDLHVAGDISAGAGASEMAFVKDGRAEVKRVAFAEVHESICQPDPEGVVDCIGGNYLLSVYIYETADLARSAWENTMMEEYGEIPPPEGFEYVSNVIDPQDSRFDGEGSCVGPYILYKNICCTIFGSWDENDRKIGSLWLDKVSGIEPPDQVNLKMEKDLSLILGYQYHGVFLGGQNYKSLRENTADQQAVQAQVFNAGDKVASNVYIQLYVQMPGEAEYSELGDPLLVGDVPSGEGRAVYTYWDLGGENIEGAVLGAQAYVPGAVDVNPDDNFVSITVNIYYAQNGENAYSHFDDAYSFKNYNFNDSETEELADELIATMAAGLPASLEKDLWLRLLFPQTYERLWKYFNVSYQSGAGGHCYGMAATSALYFQDPSLMPVAKKTGEMSIEEARQNIDIYHRAQMIPLIGSLLSDVNPYFERGYGQNSDESQRRTYAAVKNSLKEDRKPLIISFRGLTDDGKDTWGHAVLAYKLVEVEGEDYKNVYIYDSNSPISELERLSKPMPAVTLWLDGFLYYSVTSGEKDYHSRNPAQIAANPVFRTIPLEDANALLPELKKMVKGWIGVLKNADKFAVDLRCPADVLFTDSSGHRVGTIGGIVINEIPGAEVVSSGEVEIYVLPMSSEYKLEVTGTGSGEVAFDVIRPDGESADVVSFQNVSIGSGSKLTGEIGSGAEIDLLKEGSSSISPALEGSISLGEIELSSSAAQSEDSGSTEDNGPESLDPVEKAIRDLQDPDVEVRREASSALVDLNDTRAVEPLIEALGDEDAEVRSNAASALGRIRDRRAVEPLIEKLSDEDSMARSSSAYALGELGDARAVDALKEALSDEDETVRIEAAAALEKLGEDATSVPEEDTGEESEDEASSESQESGSSISIFSAQKIYDQKGGTANPDGTKIAYLERIDSDERYVIAGPEGRINGSFYKSVRDFVFSPNGEHYAYKALVGEKRIAVVDGIEGQEYNEIYRIIFSQDGEHYIYMADRGDGVVVVVEGKEEGPYESTTGDPVVSSSGQHVLYTIVRDGTNYVVVDGVVQEQVGYNPIVSPDGNRWAYSRSASYVGDPCYIVADGDVMDMGHDNRIGQMVFSPDGGRFAYDLIPGGGAYGNHMVTVDGSEGKEYPFPGVGNIVFSPDGSRFAYWAKSENVGFVMVLDGVEGRTYDEISDPIFSPGGDHVAYTAKDKDGKFVVLDGQEGDRYIDIWGMTFSIDGRLAYVARANRDGKEVQIVVVDGQEDQPFHYDWYGQGIRSGPVFAPDGLYAVYIANDGGLGEYAVIDGTRISHPWTFLGGLSWGEGSPLVFDSGDEFHYIAENESGIYLITANISDARAL